ncbi:MAG: malate synthase G, partial [Rhodobacteraceae bacterium]|nr:malate synthase G [Paracoccaceae bacterium]
MAVTSAAAARAGYVMRGGLQVDALLADFVEGQALPGTGIDPATFWAGFGDLVATFGPQIAAALDKRDALQGQLDRWHRAHPGMPGDPDAYKAFLTEIGYLEPEVAPFRIETTGTDPEIASVAGPQLVVPATNARYVLNAANARWGSLYDALYGTDALGDLPPAGGFDTERGKRVIAWAKTFLDDVVPLADGSHAAVTRYHVENGALVPALKDAEQFAGFAGEASNPAIICIKNNGLHIILDVNPAHPVGVLDPAGLCDIRLESALSAIIDCEDSVAAVDAEDKVTAYANWLGLMRGDLQASFEKSGKTVARRLEEDVVLTAPDGGALHLKGRALLLVRNVGHLMTTPAVLTPAGEQISEGLMDAVITMLIAMHDLKRPGGNSVAGSAYVVKPKMHGSAEVALTDAIFTAVERMLGLPQYTVKIGIMDEERRTSANLANCIHAARHRVAFINTGFLDRTGDEIHSAMEAGPMLRKGDMKTTPWLIHYEDRNVEIGLACGLQGRAQIGKG